MSVGAMVELAIALVVFAAGVVLYRRRGAGPAPDGYGSQGAVILIVIAVILVVHALRLLEYRPSQSEMEMMQQEQAR